MGDNLCVDGGGGGGRQWRWRAEAEVEVEVEVGADVVAAVEAVGMGWDGLGLVDTHGLNTHG